MWDSTPKFSFAERWAELHGPGVAAAPPVLAIPRLTKSEMPNFFYIDELSREREKKGDRYLEFLRVPAMSAGVYILPNGATDLQKPHRQDEMYYVVEGRARMQIGSDHMEIRPGSIVFVEADLEHRFYDIEEDLKVLVFFAPAEQE